MLSVAAVPVGGQRIAPVLKSRCTVFGAVVRTSTTSRAPAQAARVWSALPFTRTPPHCGCARTSAANATAAAAGRAAALFDTSHLSKCASPRIPQRGHSQPGNKERVSTTVPNPTATDRWRSRHAEPPPVRAPRLHPVAGNKQPVNGRGRRMVNPERYIPPRARRHC